MKPKLLVKMKDGRIGLGHPYSRKGVKMIEILGSGFYINNLGVMEVEYAIHLKDIDELIKVAGRWTY